jgi:cysteine synthase A
MRIAKDLIELVGNTPPVRINRLSAGAAGLIHEDTIIVEPTNGNTGIALAMARGARGYKSST